MSIKSSILAGSAMLLALSSCMQKAPKVNIYPGNPEDDFAPELVRDNMSRNLALGRQAFASSSHDFNMTAQLVTDGMVEKTLPPYIVVSKSSGPVPRNEREWVFDLKVTTGVTLDGPSDFLRLDMFNYDLSFDKIQVVADVNSVQGAGETSWSVAFEGSEDGETWTEYDRTNGRGTRINVSLKKAGKDCRHYRLVFDSANAQSWKLTDWDFMKEDVTLHFADIPQEAYWRGDLLKIVPGELFYSAWMSGGNDRDWVYVDLGAKCGIKSVKLDWIGDMPEGMVQISGDAVKWRDVAPVSESVSVNRVARYVRVLCKGKGPWVLSEMEVWGRGGLTARPRPQPAAKDGRLDLAGGNWKIQRANLVKASAAAVDDGTGNATQAVTALAGPQISSPGYNDSDWLAATVPGTALVSYVNAGAVPEPNYSDNQNQISDSFFNSDFWYRDTFTMPEDMLGKRLFLNFDGINWKADIFLNGVALGRIEGAFLRGRYDVTDILKPGVNALAVKIEKNSYPSPVKERTIRSTDLNGGMLGADNPTFHATTGWDWIPTVRGRDIGIWNDVYVTATGDVTIEDPFVRSELNSPANDKAVIFAESGLTNHGTKPVSGTLKFRFGEMSFQKPVSLAAGETLNVVMDPQNLENPELWWPVGYGEPHLYDVDVCFEADGVVTDSKSFKGGVRQMTFDENDGRLSLYVNGRRFIGRGGNWGFSESNLLYRDREYDAAVRYHKEMNFTMIRDWVGQIGDEEFYEACDRWGVMVWQDFWLANPWDGPDPYDEAMFETNAADYLKRIRNHASIGLYCGRNEGMPTATLDASFKRLVSELHPGIHYIPHSSKGVVSGEGPYRALPPKEYFNLFGADRFHSERGMPNVMTYESFARTIPEEQAWPIDRLWGVHDFTMEGAQHADTFIGMVDKGFGEPADANEFCQLAQWINYDGYRAMFEGRAANRRGLLLWMSHPCWPSMVWQTYDYYLNPTAAYFACKKANEPLHIQFNSFTGKVEVVNYSAGNGHNLTAAANIFNMDGTLAWGRKISVVSDEDTTVEAFALDVPSDISDVYFISLSLLEDGVEVSRNFYWQGVEEGNWQALRGLGKTSVDVDKDVRREGDVWIADMTLGNESEIPALMLRVKAVDRRSGEVITPAVYSDNYFFLMPGEERHITVEVADFDSHGKPEFELEGFNIR